MAEAHLEVISMAAQALVPLEAHCTVVLWRLGDLSVVILEVLGHGHLWRPVVL